MITIDSRKVFDTKHPISNEDYESLDLVLNTPLRLAKKDFNLGELISKYKIIIELKERKYDSYSIDAGVIYARLEQLKKQQDIVYKKYSDARDKWHKYGDVALGEKCQRLERELGAVSHRIRKAEQLLEMSVEGKIEVVEEVMGEFISSPEPKIVLYYKNIQDASSASESGLVPVFVHEMFHAWNYFLAGGHDSTVREIDEAMVEFATIYFLDSLAESFKKTDSRKEMLISERAEWQKRSVKKKKEAAGNVAAYGFGSYLADKVREEAPLWLEAYAAKSASLKPSNIEVTKVVKDLAPFYPFDIEELVLMRLEDVIFGKGGVQCNTIADKAKIIKVLEGVSPAVVAHIKANPKADYKLFAKEIKHSDLCGGKRMDLAQGNDKNILYYLTVKEMDAMGLDRVARQSNLLVPKVVYDALSVHVHKGVVINFKLANDSAIYFTPKYSMKVVSALGKAFPWKSDKCTYNVESGPFTSMHMTYGDQGVGTSNDPEFQALRRNIFVDDVVYFLVETIGSTKNLFVMLSKANEFYEVLGMPRPSVKIPDEKEVKMTEQEVREKQDAWKDLLAQEMMQHASSDTEVFCPLTRIKGTYETLKMLFIASHIKAYADCDEHEKYDIHNGLLLTAGADALFDKHMITISEDKDIIFSFLIKDDAELKKSLCLDQEVFKEIFTPRRMEYVKEHRRIFFEKESERRSKICPVSDVATPKQAAHSTDDIIANICVNLKRDEIVGLCLSDASKGTFLIAPYENIRHKKWILKERVYNTLITKKDMSDQTLGSFPDTLVLYDRYDPNNLFAYALNDCTYLKGGAMTRCPLEIDKDQSYLVYTLGNAISVNIDMGALLRHVNSKCGADAMSKLIFIKN